MLCDSVKISVVSGLGMRGFVLESLVASMPHAGAVKLLAILPRSNAAESLAGGLKLD